MGSVLWLAIGIAISSTLLGSVAFQFLTPNIVSPGAALEEKCEKIAKEAFKIHASYPDLLPDQIPIADMNRLNYLDEIWINDCVSGLPAESIFNIVNKVEQNFYSGE
jgi:hypothetical protein